MGISKEPVKIRRTKQDKGFEISINVTAYDNGIVEVDGIPQDRDGWAGAAVTVSEKVFRLWRAADNRRRANVIVPHPGEASGNDG